MVEVLIVVRNDCGAQRSGCVGARGWYLQYPPEIADALRSFISLILGGRYKVRTSAHVRAGAVCDR